MILKFRDNDGVWNWIDDIRSIRKLPSTSDSVPFKTVGTAVNDSSPLIVEISLRDSDFQVYEIYSYEAYLCNDTGSTIDVLQSPNG